MRNFKRTLALVLAVLVVVGTFATVSAAEKKWYQPGIDYIQSIGVDTITPAKAEQKITRNDFVLWIAKIESHQLSENAWKETVSGVDFTDVTDEHHKAAIAYSKQAKFIIGNGDGTFAPDKATTLGEASAVIVRVMGYEDKVYDTSSENWAYNYMRAAQAHCYAFNDTFLEETGIYNPDHELTYGEAAYILATIMNHVVADENGKDVYLSGKDLPIVTADGINLGDYFVGKTLGVIESTYYVVSMPRFVEQITRATQKLIVETNLLDTKGADVVLKDVNSDNYIAIPGEDFLKYVRVALGLPEQNDYMNEADEISVFAEVPLGSMVTIKTDRQTGEFLNFDITVGDTNSVVVDTYVRATSLVAGAAVDTTRDYASKENFSAKYLGWHTNAVAEAASMVPVLPTSYTADLATSWSDLAYNEDETVITSATLTFKGVEYVVGGKESTLEVLNSDYEVLTADEAVKTLINAAQGSVYAVFNDIDFDGKYDTVVVYKSNPFMVFSGVYNLDPSYEDRVSQGKYYAGAVSTSISNGETVKDPDGKEIIETAKQSPIGTIMMNASVARPNEDMKGGKEDLDPDNYLDDAWTNLCGDVWWGAKMNKIPSGKMQLVIAAPDGHGVLGTEDSNAKDGTGLNYNYVHPVYEVVDLATFATGIIEQIDAVTLEDYYIANIRVADGSLKTVYIPVTPEEKATFDVTIAGATAEWTFDSSKWCTLLEEAEAAVKAGIVSGVDPDKTFDPATLTEKELHELTAAWLAGKYVDFVTNDENVVIALFGTDKATSTEGFVVKATTEGKEANNVYDVTIATSGVNNHKNADTYVTKILKSYVGVDNYSAMGDMIMNQGIHTFKGYNSFISLKGFIEDPNDPDAYIVADGTTVTIDGVDYVADKNGKLFIESSNAYRNAGVAGTKTVEVRASASSIFDWANYDVYSTIFAGKLLNPNYNKTGYNTTYNAVTGASEVEPGTDLIYVQVIEDAGSNYLKYIPYTDEVPAVANDYLSAGTINGLSTSWRGRWYYPVVDAAYKTAMGNWTPVTEEHIIDIVEVKVLHEGMHVLDNGVCVCGTADCKNIGLVDRTALYNAVVGIEPYYVRSYNVEDEAYEYVIKYRTVYVYEGIIGTQEGIIDTTKTLMTALYYGGTGLETVQVKVTEDTEKIYTLANGYFVDDNGYVYALYESEEYENGYVVEFKKDKDGKYLYTEIEYNFDAENVIYEDHDIALVDVADKVEAATGLTEVAEVEATYATVEFVAKKSGDKGYYPGTAYFVVDGVKYSVAPNTPVVLVTPSANGFTTSVYTAKDIVSKKIEFFAVEWNATFDADNNMFGIALLGNVAGVKLGTDVVEDDEPVITEEERVVYLNESAKAVIRAGHNDKGWMVISDEAAIEIPSGESVGQIYRYYETYAEAKKAAEIDITIAGGKYYLIDKDCEIKSHKDIVPEVGVITDESASGKTMADMDIYDADDESVDVSKLNFVWYYRDVEGNLVKAGNNKSVNIIDAEGFDKLVEKLVKARDDAKAVLEVKEEIYKAGNLSQTKYDYYKAEYEAAETALNDALIANTEKYYNGQFWGFANSPYYAYVQMGAGSFQQEVSNLYFQYIVVDDVYCVFSDSYTFTAPAK